MAKRVKSKRSYESPRRREQAEATRRMVLEAARDLFVQRGYVATTVDAIADRARVSSETVYGTFKNKRTLLSHLLDRSIAGNDAPVPILERDWVQDMREQPDPRVRLKILARSGRLILERRAPIEEVLRGAAGSDPEIATLCEHSKAQRYAGQRELLRILVGSQGLRPGLSEQEAADTLFCIGSPETFRLLVVDRGWSPSRFERWYEETLDRLFFADRSGLG